MMGDDTNVDLRGTDGIDYSVTLSIRWYDEPGGDIVILGSVAPAQWGTRHDRIDDSYVVIPDRNVTSSD